jgi:putative endopeptidase
MAAAFAMLHAQGASPGFNVSIRPDPHNSARYIIHLSQGGLGLPEREYYFANDEKSVKLREAYVAHIASMSELLGVQKDTARKGAESILALETALAQASMVRADARDPDKTYNLMRLNDLRMLAPNFSWSEYFAALDIAAPGDINVGQPEFFKAFSRLLADTPTTTWRDYTSWHNLRQAAPYIGGEFSKLDFAFYGKQLTGAEQPEPLDKRVIDSIDRTMGEALGQLFVAKAFSPAAKAKALDLVQNVKLALRDRIETLDWMSPATQKEALAKLDAINVKIGYPDQWKDYSGLEIRPDDYVGNVFNTTRAEFRRQIDRLGKPVDRSLWSMTPSTVNAYYSPSLNEIVFPAGILQPPYFDVAADDASNYGGIGMVIGH